jgi:hypothetical protein
MPTVPCPAITAGSSNGWIIVKPWRAPSLLASAAACKCVCVCVYVCMCVCVCVCVCRECVCVS